MSTEPSFGYLSRDEALAKLGIPDADDPKLAAITALSWGGNALKVLRVNATENGWELVAVGAADDAWEAYAPTLVPASGAFASASATGRFKRMGKTVFVSIKVSIAANGNAASYITVGLPLPAANSGQNQTIVGQELNVTGHMAVANVQANTATAHFTRYDGTYIGGDGRMIVLSGVYEAA